MGEVFCEKVENRGVFVKKVESEGFVKKVDNGGFVKKWTFPQRRVHYVFFILHFTYWGGIRAQRTPLSTGLCDTLNVPTFAMAEPHYGGLIMNKTGFHFSLL